MTKAYVKITHYLKIENILINLQTYMSQNSMSMSYLSEKAYLGATTISNWYNGTSIPNESILEKLCASIGIDLHTLAMEPEAFKSHMYPNPITEVLMTYERFKYKLTDVQKKEFVKKVVSDM